MTEKAVTYNDALEVTYQNVNDKHKEICQKISELKNADVLMDDMIDGMNKLQALEDEAQMRYNEIVYYCDNAMKEQNKCITLKKDVEIKKIYHIGDIHIRKDKGRNEEYREIFRKFYDDVKKDSENALIVCTGDIFHDGTSAESMDLAKDVFIKLSELCDIVIIRGNHDQTVKSNPDASNYASSVLSRLRTNNNALYILGSINMMDNMMSKTYEYGNILFGYTDVAAKEVYCIKSHDNDKITIGSKTKIKIGLWHGTLGGSVNDSGIDLSKRASFKKSDFDGYDYVLLGDIHKHQYLNAEKTIAYCGSMIQQDHGESYGMHGYIKWDLVNKISEFVNLVNAYGYITLELQNNVMPKLENIPKKLHLKLKHKQCSNEFIKGVYEKIQTKCVSLIEYDEQKYQDDVTFTKAVEGDAMDLENDDVTTDRLMKYIKNSVTTTDITEENKIKIEKKIKEVLKRIQYQYKSAKKTIELKSLIFNNVNVYGTGNCIDYEMFKDHNVVGICGRNGIGKSSAVEFALMLAIYGEGEASSKIYEYINNRSKMLSTLVKLTVNNVPYEIYRNCRRKNDIRDSKGIIILRRDGDDISGKNKAETEGKIKEIFGTIDTFREACRMSQKVDDNFLSFSDKKKKEKISNMLRLDVYEKIRNEIKRDDNETNSMLRLMRKTIYDDNDSNIAKRNEKETKIQERITELDELKIDIETKIATNTKSFNEINNELILKRAKLEELEKLDFSNIEGMEDLQEQIDAIEKEKKELEECVHISESKKNKYQSDLKQDKFKDIEHVNNTFEEEKKRKIKQMEEEIGKLQMEYVKLGKKTIDIEVVKQEYDDLKIEEQKVNKEIAKLTKLLAELLPKIEQYKQDKKNTKGYEKYLEYAEKDETIRQKMEHIQNDIDETDGKLKKGESKYETYIATRQKYEEEMKKCANGDFEKKQNALIESIRKDIQKKIMLCEKVDVLTDDIKDENELDELTIHLKELQERISKKGEIADNLRKKMQDIKEIDNLEEKYTDALKARDVYNSKVEELKTIKKQLKECVKQLELMKDHKYNKKCEACMSNKLTNHKMVIEAEQKKLEEAKMQCEKEILKKEKEYNEMKKYEELYSMKDDNKTLVDCELDIERAKNESEQIKKKLKSHNDYIENERRKETTKKINSEVKIMEKQIVDIKEQLKTCIKAREKFENLEEKMKDYNSLLENKKLLTEKMQKCKETEKTLNEKYAEYIKYGKLHEKFELNEKKYLELEQQKKQCDMQQKNIMLQIDNNLEKQKEYDKYVTNAARNEEIDKKIKKINIMLVNKKEEINTTYEEYKKLSDKQSRITQEIMEITNKIGKLEIKLIKMKKDFSDNEEMIKKKELMDTLVEEVGHIQREHKILSKESVKLSEEQSEINTELIGLNSDIKKIRETMKEIENLEENGKLHKKIMHIIDNEFIDDILANQYIPQFQKVVNDILASFVNFKMDMKYNCTKESKTIEVQKLDKNGLYSSASKLSCSETLMSNIAFRLAINKIDRVYKTNFFIIDEGFAYCDEEALTRMGKMFDYMKEEYDFIMIISHDEQIKSYATMTMHVEEKDGYSRINMINENNKAKFEKYEKILRGE